MKIFKNLKQFLAFLDNLAPEYQKERKIIKNNFDENILGLFVDESKRPNQRLYLVQIKLADVGLAKDWIDFIVESFGIALGWENEQQNLRKRTFISVTCIRDESPLFFLKKEQKNIDMN